MSNLIEEHIIHCEIEICKTTYAYYNSSECSWPVKDEKIYECCDNAVKEFGKLIKGYHG